MLVTISIGRDKAEQCAHCSWHRSRQQHIPDVGLNEMRNKRKMTILLTATLLLAASIFWIVLARQHRAIALQPLDFARAISSEYREADSRSQAWRMVKAVSSMFWDSYEVRMVDGRAFSSIPFYRPPTTTEKLPQEIDGDDVRIEIIGTNQINREVQPTNSTYCR